MESIDLVKINFSKDQLDILNLCLAFIMFGVALDIRLSDLKRVFVEPKAGAVGLISQLLFLPILTLLLIHLLQPPLSLAIGMMLIGVCPGGNVSNFAVHLAKGNTALSISMTSIVTLGSVVLLPLAFFFWSRFIPGLKELPPELQVDASEMFQTIIYLIVIPLTLGMMLKRYAPEVVDKIIRPVRVLSIIIFLSFVVFAALGNWEHITAHLHKVFFLVLIHNGLALLMGYAFAKTVGLSDYDAKAISIETGIQNSGLALILIFNFFDGVGGMAIIAAWWGIWHLITAFALASVWGTKV